MSIKHFAKKVGAGVLAAMAVSSSAFAELPAAVGTGITGVQTDALALQALIWVPLIAITAGFVMMKIFKRGANKI